MLISHANKVILKIFQTRLQQYMNQELSDVQTVLRKGRATRDQIANICCIIERAREFQKNIYFSSLTTLKTFTVWLTTNCGKFLKRWEHLSPEKPACGQEETELNFEQLTRSKLGKEYVKAVYYHLA